METLNIRDRMDAVIVDKLGVDRSELMDTASIGEDLGADSLDQVELTMAFEEEFEIEISDAEAEMVVTVGDALALLKRLVPASPQRAPVGSLVPPAPKPSDVPEPMMMSPAAVTQLLELHKGFLDTLAAHFGPSFGEPGQPPYANGGVVFPSRVSPQLAAAIRSARHALDYAERHSHPSQRGDENMASMDISFGELRAIVALDGGSNG